MSDGMGCKCMARSEGECCCVDVDWTPTVFFHDDETRRLEQSLRGRKLRDQVAILWNELKAHKQELHRNSLEDGDLRDILSDFLQTGAAADLEELRRIFERQRR